ncbi:MAG: quorum-sensing autoinducer CAI-1 synthase [Sulfuricellaceae bacterium]|nr:quorum-sensing autoinducer CAI-1 synthase [Sulfuricellaceae bacterium]
MGNNITNLRVFHQPNYPKDPEFLALRVNRFYREKVQNSLNGKHILRGGVPGQDAICLMSNDYLSLADHPDILRTQAEALIKDGNGMLMSAVFLNGETPQHLFEQRLASFMRAERGLLCQSGWCANTGLIQTIADERTPVYLDMLAHMSLWEGARSAGATVVAFIHNDPEHLERQILKHGPGVIAVDSVYSTDGSVCPLKEIVAIGVAQGCVLVVDESHSLGTHGEHGEGLTVSMGLEDQVHFRTASLAKAFSGRAGFITCSERFHEYFICESRPSVFSSSMLPHEIAALNQTLSIIQGDDWRRETLHANASYLREHLDRAGYNLRGSQSQIISLESGSVPQTIALRDSLEKRGLFGAPFWTPATPMNRSIIRFSVNSTLTKTDLNRIVQICDEIRDEVDMANWASTRRKRSVSRCEETSARTFDREFVFA